MSGRAPAQSAGASARDSARSVNLRSADVLHGPAKDAARGAPFAPGSVMDTQPALKRILVPLDGSELADRTVRHMHPLFLATKAEALLLRALNLTATPAAEGRPLLDLISEAEVALKHAALRLGQAGVRVSTRVVPGPAAEAIVDTAASAEADLIAMSTHGRTGFERFTIGSVTDKVVRASRAPVLVLPARAEAPSGFRRILVPFDGSPFSLKVAAAVRAFARPIDAHVHLVHVLEPLWEGVAWAVPERSMKEAADGFIAACLPTTTEIRKGDAAVQLLEAASEQRADMIAMATHGRTGPVRWALGSVTEKVLRAANVPMLLVCARKEDSHA